LARALSRRRALKPGERVERILQDGGRREGIEHRGALARAKAGLIGRLLGGEGRQALVPEQDRETELGLEPGREGAHRLAARPLAAVHVERPADHQGTGRALADQRLEPRAVAARPERLLDRPGAQEPRLRREGRGRGGLALEEGRRARGDREGQRSREAYARPTRFAITNTPAMQRTAPVTSNTAPALIMRVIGMNPEEWTIACGGVETGSMNP